MTQDKVDDLLDFVLFLETTHCIIIPEYPLRISPLGVIDCKVSYRLSFYRHSDIPLATICNNTILYNTIQWISEASTDEFAHVQTGSLL